LRAGLAIACALLAGGCGATAATLLASNNPPDTAQPTPSPPYGVGERIITFVDYSRHIRLPDGTIVPRTLQTIIRYPAYGPRSEVDVNRARIAPGRFPLVIFGHGFAVTPYGEWHAMELEIFVRDLGFTPAEALRCATSVNARFMANGSRIGMLEAGRFADFIAVDGSPLENIAILQDKSRIRHVHIGGKRMQIPERSYDPRQVTDKSLSNWSDLYTQERVRELYPARHRLAAAAE